MIALMVVVLAMVYVLALVFYARSGQSKVNGNLPAEVDSGFNVHLDITAVDAAKNSVTFQIALEPIGEYQEQSGGLSSMYTFAKPVRVTLWDQSVGSISRIIPAGEVYGSKDSIMYVTGDYSRYPFDRFSLGLLGGDPDPATPDPAQPLITVEAVDAAGKPILVPDPTSSDGTSEKVVPLGVASGWEPSRLQGWTQTWSLTAAEPDVASFIGSTLFLDLTLKRSGGTLAIVVVMLLLMITLAVIALAVSSRVAMQRRRIEATMSSWLAGMLFALIPLRNFLPGAPPVGSWMDILVFFWVLFGLMASIVIFIGSWLKFSRPPEYALRSGMQYPDPQDLPPALAKKPEEGAQDSASAAGKP